MNKFFTKYTVKLLFLTLSIVGGDKVISQTTTTNYQGFTGCSGPLNLFTFDFTSTTNNSITQTVSTQNSDNQCCGLANNFGCSMFVIITDPSAVGVTFSTSGPCGNVNFYYENCGVTVTCGNQVCLNPGTNTHYFLMCRTGGPDYEFTFNQILAPEAAPDIITTEGCNKIITVTGLDPVSIQWNSISPGAPGDFNGLLSCTSGCPSTTFTPIVGTPSTVSYQVCGTVPSPCSSPVFCDTVSVTTYPTLFANPGPSVAICNGSVTGAPVTASVTGGTAPYTYTWSGPGGFSEINTTSATTNTVTAMLPGTYTVTISDITGCPSSSTTIDVTSFNVDIVANAGPDITVCRTPVPTITINGSVSGTNSGIWSGGTGTYVNGATSLNLQYIPSAAELAAGSVTLTLTPTNTGGCPFTTDQVTIFLPQFTASLSALSTDIACNGLTNGSVDLTVTGTPAPFSYAWSNGSTIEDITGLGVGSYTVIVTDGNGCTGTISATVTQPPILTATTNVSSNYNGFGVSCFGSTDGSLSVTAGGGVPGYSYSWSNGSTSPTPTGVGAGTYTVTVTDQNGCTASSSVVVTEPPALTQTITAFQYPSGTNISCFGFSNGSTDVTIGGGVPGYSYVWSTGSTNEDLSGLPAGSYTVTATDINGCTISASITLSQPSALTQSIIAFQYPSGSNISCFGLSDGSIDVTIGGGSPGYTYAWSTSSSNEDLNGLPAGSYTVTATDINGCTISASITLSQPSALTQSITAFQYPSGSNISCFGLNDGSIDVTIGGGAPGYTYAWNTGSSNEDLNGLPAGTYTVTATDINNCTISGTITLIQPPALTQGISANTFIGGWNISCFGLSDGSIDVTIGGGSPGYTYSWNTGSTNEDLSGLPIGTYTVTATDINGCTITASITLIQPPVITSFASTFDVLCFGNSTGSIDVTFNGGTPGYTFAWNSGQASEDLVNIPAGTYTVTATDQNGCTLSLSATILQPADTVIIDGVISNVNCFNGNDGAINITVSGGTPGYSYQWSNGATTEDISSLIAGTYTVTVTDASGCSYTNNIDFIVMQPQSPLQITGVVTNVSCFGGVNGGIDITVTGGTQPYNYIWSNGATSEDLTDILAGEYTVTVTDNQNCLQSENYSVSEPPLLVINADVNDNKCYGFTDASIDIEVVGGVPGYTYLWNNGATTPDITDLAPGNYVLTVTDANNCTGVASFNVAAATEVVVQLDSLIEIFITESATLIPQVSGGTGNYTFLWSPPDFVSCITCEITDVSPLYNMEYVLLAIDENGCTDIAVVDIIVREELFIPNTFTPNGDGTNDTFSAVSRLVQSYEMLIFNRWGDLIYETDKIDAGWNGYHNGKECPQGVYVYKIYAKFWSGKEKEYTGQVNLLR